jgi:hypothetical protein
MGAISAKEAWDNISGSREAAAAAGDLRPETGASRADKVFHWPQPGHWPRHWAEVAPQEEQTWIVFVFMGRGGREERKTRGETPFCSQKGVSPLAPPSPKKLL